MFGSYFDFCVGWWEYRKHPDFLFLTYEDMKADHAGTVSTLARFLHKALPEDQISSIVQFTGFQAMRDRPNAKINKTEETAGDKTTVDNGVSEATGSQDDKTSQEETNGSAKDPQARIGSQGFFRKGQVGDWINFLSRDQSEAIETRVTQVLQPIGLHFTYN